MQILEQKGSARLSSALSVALIGMTVFIAAGVLLRSSQLPRLPAAVLSSSSSAAYIRQDAASLAGEADDDSVDASETSSESGNQPVPVGSALFPRTNPEAAIHLASSTSTTTKSSGWLVEPDPPTASASISISTLPLPVVISPGFGGGASAPASSPATPISASSSAPATPDVPAASSTMPIAGAPFTILTPEPTATSSSSTPVNQCSL